MSELGNKLYKVMVLFVKKGVTLDRSSQVHYNMSKIYMFFGLITVKTLTRFTTT
jgi:hypothetical protein